MIRATSTHKAVATFSLARLLRYLSWVGQQANFATCYLDCDAAGR